jgi:hypothetical protein
MRLFKVSSYLKCLVCLDLIIAIRFKSIKCKVIGWSVRNVISNVNVSLNCTVISLSAWYRTQGQVTVAVRREGFVANDHPTICGAHFVTGEQFLHGNRCEDFVIYFGVAISFQRFVCLQQLPRELTWCSYRVIVYVRISYRWPKWYIIHVFTFIHNPVCQAENNN